jgi:hypothetical protein
MLQALNVEQLEKAPRIQPLGMQADAVRLEDSCRRGVASGHVVGAPQDKLGKLKLRLPYFALLNK